MEVIESDNNVNQATVFNKRCASCETRDLNQQHQQLQPIVMYLQHNMEFEYFDLFFKHYMWACVVKVRDLVKKKRSWFIL